MSHELAPVETRTLPQLARPLDANMVLERIAQIEQIQQKVMKEHVHYGPPNGRKNDDLDDDKKLRPVLLQPGAEKLLTTFRLAADFPRQDLICTRTDVGISYEVRCVITDQVTGAFLGSEWGACSSLEEKYAWRRTYIDEEYEATPATHKRIKFSKYDGRVKEIKQIRVNADDMQNTILSMACKRAKVRATRAALAASDLFDVNTEDLPDELREEYFGEDEEAKTQRAARQQKAGSMEQKARAGSSGTRTPPPAPAVTGPTLDRSTVREILQLVEQIHGFTMWDAEKGKNTWTKDAFAFFSKLGVKGKVTDQSPQMGAAVLAALQELLTAQIAATQPEPTDGIEDITDPFADQ